MKPILLVDFNNSDADGAVRLTTAGALSAMESMWVPTEGAEVFITDDELYADAVVGMSNGMWVARVRQWLDAPPRSDGGDGS